jgi:hypothetical protein
MYAALLNTLISELHLNYTDKNNNKQSMQLFYPHYYVIQPMKVYKSFKKVYRWNIVNCFTINQFNTRISDMVSNISKEHIFKKYFF